MSQQTTESGADVAVRPSRESVSHWDPSAARLPRAEQHEVRAMLAAAQPSWEPFPTVDDRAAWESLARRLGPGTVDELTRAGTRAASTPVSTLSSTLWRTFLRSGERLAYENPWYERRDQLADLIVAYALAPAEPLLDALTDVVWAICEETTWAFPAHDVVEFPDPEAPVVDLFAALTAVGLAEVMAVAGRHVPAPLVERVRREVDRRVVTPYLERDDWPWMFASAGRRVSNWTAVCAFGAAGAACYLEEDADRMADVLVKAARSLEDYLAMFDPEGGTSEGIGYWSFGFGSFCQLADLVERRTGGAWNWFEAPIVDRVARFPLRSRTGPSAWVTFSDADAGTVLPGWLLHDLARRRDIPALADLGTGTAVTWNWRRDNSAVTTALRSVFSSGRNAPAVPAPPADASDWFPGLQWYIGRTHPSDGVTLSAALKGGHNDEAHNQNDVGSLIVRVGDEDLVVDPGSGLYTRDYFNEHRYEHLVNSSRGHSVPAPAHTEQPAGAEYEASVISVTRGDAGDEVALDLTGAYPASAGLRFLRRTLSLHRGDTPFLRLTDAFSFTGSGVAETSFTTFADIETADGHLVLRGQKEALRIGPPQGAKVEITTNSEEVTLRTGQSRLLRRLSVRTAEASPHTELSFTFHPVPHP